ncbi:MAG: type II secretion system protein GspM [Burkholderiales bacterium]
MKLPESWSPALEKYRAAWSRLDARERTGVLAAAAALFLLVFVMLLVNPALKTLREAPARLAQLDSQLAQMQSLAAEAKRLQQLPAVNPAQAAEALQAATAYLGPDAKLQLQGDRATLSFQSLSGEQIGAWLAEVRSAARARPVEAQLQQGPRGYGGSIVLALASGNPS